MLDLHMAERLRKALQSGEAPAIMKAADAILAESPDHYDALEAKSTLLATPLQYHDDRRAVELVEGAVRRNPTDDRYRVLLAFVNDLINEYGEAERIYREVLTRDPRRYEALRGLSLLFRYPGATVQVGEALRLLERAIEVDPNRWEAYMTYAQVLREANRPDEAVGAYDAAMDRLPAKYSRIAPDLQRERNEAELAAKAVRPKDSNNAK
jgi:tetratricopeptide (TPR) repeat protein